MVLQIALVSQLRFKSNWWRTGVEITTGIPPAEEHQLTFDVKVADVARIVQYQTFPSKPGVRDDGGGILAKPCAYVVRVDNKNDDVYTAAISFPSRAEFRLACGVTGQDGRTGTRREPRRTGDIPNLERDVPLANVSHIEPDGRYYFFAPLGPRESKCPNSITRRGDEPDRNL